MHIRKNKLLNNVLVTFPKKIIALYFVLFFVIPAIFFGTLIISLKIYLLIKLLLIYVFCIVIPLIVLYLAICTTHLLVDIFTKNKRKRFIDYYI